MLQHSLVNKLVSAHRCQSETHTCHHTLEKQRIDCWIEFLVSMEEDIYTIRFKINSQHIYDFW